MIGPRMVRATLLPSCAAAVAALSACGSGPSPDPVAKGFLAAWSRGDFAAAARQTGTPRAQVVSFYRQLESSLDVTHASFALVRVERHGGRATARFTAALTLGGLGVWRYVGSMPLVETRRRWLVSWSPSVFHPALSDGADLFRTRSLPARAPILDARGDPLFRPTPVVTVGILPKSLRNADQAVATLAQTTGADPARVRTLLKGAQRTVFVPVITLRLEDFDPVRAKLQAVPGIEFQPGQMELAPTRTFARAVLGEVGPATAEVLQMAGSQYDADDQLGLSGLQLHYQRRLAGAPTGGVYLADAGGNPRRRLFWVTGSPALPVRTTLDSALQNAAESALGAISKPAALVAVRPSTGAIAAVANRPGGSALDHALVDALPPGSSFKVVTAAALLEAGLSPSTTVECRPTVAVGGKSFKNFEAQASGPVPFSQAFAQSCNTAFVSLSRRLDASSLEMTARSFGFGQGWSLPAPTFTGQVPSGGSALDTAADAIGQGRVLVSPLDMALVAATVASGRFQAPSLVTDPPAARAAASPALGGRVAAELRTLMRAVVTQGTGVAANVPGAPVYGKTGTAEFGGGNPPPTHAWFIGYRGDLAFAVVVEGGGVGGEVAAPIAARFLTAAGAR